MIRAGALKRMRSKSLSSEEPSSQRSKEDGVDPMKSTPGKEEMEEKDRSARRFEDPFTKMAKDTFDLEREKAEKDRSQTCEDCSGARAPQDRGKENRGGARGAAARQGGEAPPRGRASAPG